MILITPLPTRWEALPESTQLRIRHLTIKDSGFRYELSRYPEAKLPGPLMIVALHYDNIVGWAAQFEKAERHTHRFNVPDGYRVTMTYVVPEQRRKGLAMCMLKKMEQCTGFGLWLSPYDEGSNALVDALNRRSKAKSLTLTGQGT
jgi:GNAT superfamily N-acetyltransferase